MAEYASTGVWYIDIGQIILSRVRERLETKYGDKDYYSDMNVTDDDKEIKDAAFPAILITVLNPVEAGLTFESDISGMLCTVQASVTDTNKSRARYVIAQITQAMKLMLFETTVIPAQEKEDTDTYTWTGRFRRMIGAGDTIPSAISDIE